MQQNTTLLHVTQCEIMHNTGGQNEMRVNEIDFASESNFNGAKQVTGQGGSEILFMGKCGNLNLQLAHTLHLQLAPTTTCQRIVYEINCALQLS